MYAVSLGRINGYTNTDGEDVPPSQVVFVRDLDSEDSLPTIRKQYPTTAEARVYAEVLTSEFPEDFAVAYPPKGTKGSVEDEHVEAPEVEGGNEQE
jgi:hypothetical protein